MQNLYQRLWGNAGGEWRRTEPDREAQIVKPSQLRGAHVTEGVSYSRACAHGQDQPESPAFLLWMCGGVRRAWHGQVLTFSPSVTGRLTTKPHVP